MATGMDTGSELPRHLDLEVYLANYQGRTRIAKALFIGEHIPDLAVDAYTLALDTIQRDTKDTRLYAQCLQHLNTALEAQHRPCVPSDTAWIKATQHQHKTTLQQLESDIRTYRTGAMRDGVRTRYTRMGDEYYAWGDMKSAMKSYHSAREYSTTSQHVLGLWFDMIKVNLATQHSTSVRSYVTRAEATTDIPNKPVSLSRLHCCKALSYLCGQDSHYETVAQSLSHVAAEASNDLNDILSPNDVAVYGGLCALATFDRTQLQTLMASPAFRSYLELEPQIHATLQAFQQSKYSLCFDLLQDYRNDLKADMYFHAHVETVYDLIREKAMVQYCTPYSTVDLHRMASALNMTVSGVEDCLVGLIGDKGLIAARIDSHAKVLTAHPSEPQSNAYHLSLKTGQAYERDAKALLLRLQLVEEKMCVGGIVVKK
ncbi:26S proteasome subunit RPN7-domain-containing protein [Spinellus fusiger]|nr:26S proteasome subunit RPN7-domain-containing protein [Spinellus fusiger]